MIMSTKKKPSPPQAKKSMDYTKVIKRGINEAILAKYAKNIKPKDDYLEYSVRGEKQTKIAEIAQIVIWLSQQKPNENGIQDVFDMLATDFFKAYGGPTGVPAFAKQTVKNYLKKFGVIKPRIGQTQKMENGKWHDCIQIWEGDPTGHVNA